MIASSNFPPTKKIIIECPNCRQNLRIPKTKERLKVSCRVCKVSFNYQSHHLPLSLWTKRYMLTGLLGGSIGFFVTEFLHQYIALIIPATITMLLGDIGTISLLGCFIGAFLGAADGYYLKNKQQFYYGITIGGLLGFMGGVFSGILGQWTYRSILLAFEQSQVLTSIVNPSVQIIIARTLGWSVFGMLLGASYGIKENTIGDLKYGLLSGLAGGAVAGVLFDPIAWYLRGQDGISRLIGFALLGMVLGFSIKFSQERALKKNSASFFKRLSSRLPNNLRLENKT